MSAREMLIAMVIATLTLGCDSRAPTDPTDLQNAPRLSRIGDTGAVTSELQRSLTELREWSAPFHDFDKAVEYGYTMEFPCVSDPDLGGMGYHYTLDADENGVPELLIDGEVNLLKPEFLVYMTDSSGRLRFGGFDYFVPSATWDVSEKGGPPSLLGEEFHFLEQFDGWAFHIWLWWENPAGIFDDFNPRVPLCP